LISPITASQRLHQRRKSEIQKPRTSPPHEPDIRQKQGCFCMKFLATVLLMIAAWLPAAGQQSSYDPAAKQPAKQRGGFVDFALKQVNPENKDYGCQVDNARKLVANETVKSITSWALLVCLSFLILSFFLLLHQHRERNHREIIAASLLTQYH